MAKDLRISVLLDFYSAALTKKQREMIELYYNQDLSLAEITEHVGITRQGVRDSIKRGEAVLLDLEKKLGLAAWFEEVQKGLLTIEEQVGEIAYVNDKSLYSTEIGGNVKVIQHVLSHLDRLSDDLGKPGEEDFLEEE